MKLLRFALAIFTLLFVCATGFGQVTRIIIAAGTPEDKQLQVISAESDAQKRIGLLDQFLKEYAGNKEAEAYGHWQLLQAYQSVGENEKALAEGQKAYELAPGNLEILGSICSVADSLKDYAALVDAAAKGGAAYNGIAAAPKPAEISAEDWATRVAQEQAGNKQSYEYLEAAALNAISGEQDAKARLALIERFNSGFPNTRFELQLSQLAMAVLQTLNDPSKSIEFGEKALKANPNNVPTLMLLANAYVEDPKGVAKAVEYAQRAVKLSPAAPETPEQRLTAGMARSTLGYALLKQDKSLQAVPELKGAVDLLADNAPVLEEALFRLGFAYAKLGRRAEATDALQKCMAMNGPYKPIAEDLLAKAKSGPARKR